MEIQNNKLGFDQDPTLPSLSEVACARFLLFSEANLIEPDDM